MAVPDPSKPEVSLRGRLSDPRRPRPEAQGAGPTRLRRVRPLRASPAQGRRGQADRGPPGRPGIQHRREYLGLHPGARQRRLHHPRPGPRRDPLARRRAGRGGPAVTARHRLLVAACLACTLLAAPARGADPVAVEPAELDRRAELVGREVVVDDRVKFFLETRRGQGYDHLVLKRTEVPFLLPARLRSARPPSEPTAVARGRCRSSTAGWSSRCRPSRCSRETSTGSTARSAGSGPRTSRGGGPGAAGPSGGGGNWATPDSRRGVRSWRATHSGSRPAGRGPMPSPWPTPWATAPFRGRSAMRSITGASASRPAGRRPPRRSATSPDASGLPSRDPPRSSRGSAPAAADAGDPAAAYRAAADDERARMDRRLYSDVVARALELRLAADPARAGRWPTRPPGSCPTAPTSPTGSAAAALKRPNGTSPGSGSPRSRTSQAVPRAGRGGPSPTPPRGLARRSPEEPPQRDRRRGACPPRRLLREAPRRPGHRRRVARRRPMRSTPSRGGWPARSSASASGRGTQAGTTRSAPSRPRRPPRPPRARPHRHPPGPRGGFAPRPVPRPGPGADGRQARPRRPVRHAGRRHRNLDLPGRRSRQFVLFRIDSVTSEPRATSTYTIAR